MLFGPNFKLINFSTVISDLYKRYGVAYVNSKEFADIIANNHPTLLLKFLFLIAYETQDAFEDTIADEYDFCQTIRDNLDAVWERIEQKNSDLMFFYRMAKSFTHQFKVLPNKDDLAAYIKRNNLQNENGLKACKDHVYSLRMALKEMQLAGEAAPPGQVLLAEMLEFERHQVVGLLIGLLQEGKAPDISSVILFSDQLEDDGWWDTVATLTWEYVQEKNKAGV